MNRKKILKDVIRAAVSAGKKAGETAYRIGKPSVEASADKVAGRVKKAANTVKEVAFIPVGLAYFKKFFDFPDKDIPILGIGAHRNFFTHSAAPVFLLSMIYTYLKSEKGKRAEIARKLLGKVAGYSAFGLGLHLLIDTFFGPKAVIFPIVGSLVKNTLWDDKLWLLSNAVLSFWKGAQLLKDSSEESVLESIPFKGDLIDFIKRKKARVEEKASAQSA